MPLKAVLPFEHQRRCSTNSVALISGKGLVGSRKKRSNMMVLQVTLVLTVALNRLLPLAWIGLVG